MHRFDVSYRSRNLFCKFASVIVKFVAHVLQLEMSHLCSLFYVFAVCSAAGIACFGYLS
jgi:hypothetical protein